MSFSTVTIGAEGSLFFVDSRRCQKVVFLPAASTVTGRSLLIKDVYGTSSNSTISLSTIGLDRIDDLTNRFILSNAFSMMNICSDGRIGWRTLDYYDGLEIPLTIPISIPTIVTTNLLTNLDASNYTSGSSTWTALTGNNQTAYNSPTTVATPGGPNAIVFNGSSYCIDTTGVFQSTLFSYTIDAWFYAATSVYGNVVGELGQASQGAWNVFLLGLNNGTMFAGFWNGYVYSINLGNYTANQWTHISCTYNSSSSLLTGYVNGVSITSGTQSKQWPGGNVYWGVGTAANPFNNLAGRVGAVKIYTRALTATEVRQNYNAMATRFGLPQI
jgi:hypothetical protein